MLKTFCLLQKPEPPKYKMKVLKKGDKKNIPRKGDTVAVWYTGRLQDGKVFDTNVVTGRFVACQLQTGQILIIIIANFDTYSHAF